MTNWDETIKEIETKVKESLLAKIEHHKKEFDYCQREQQYIEVLNSLLKLRPFFRPSFEPSDYEDQRSRARLETDLIYQGVKLIEQKRNHYKPEEFAERLCTMDLPKLIQTYSFGSLEASEVSFLKTKYKNNIKKFLEHVFTYHEYHQCIFREVSLNNFRINEVDSPVNLMVYLEEKIPYSLLDSTLVDLHFNIAERGQVLKVQNFHLVFRVLRELKIFVNSEGMVPHQKDYFRQLGFLFGLNGSNNHSNQMQLVKHKQSSLKIFEKMLEIAKELCEVDDEEK